jgi:transcriptional regulator of NAD metabolism
MGAIMMDTETRRTEILLRLEQAGSPVSATALAKDFNVSRQVIVGDIALLRARGGEIISTARGYMMARPPLGRYIGTIVCRHDRKGTERELSAIVDAGGEILDVTIAHQYYGDLTGQLNVATHEDVAEFMRHMDEAGEHLL